MRSCVLLIAALALLMPSACQEHETPFYGGRLGLQLYSLRHTLPDDVPGGLRWIHGQGLHHVEGGNYYGKTAAAFRRQLDEAGLQCPSVMYGYERYGEELDSIAAEAKILGASYAGIAWIPHDSSFRESHLLQAVQDFNAWGKALKAKGLTFFYHPHGYEFQPYGSGTMFDYLVANTDPDAVKFELDVFWAAHGGADPAALLRAYPDRFVLMHVKDLKQGAAGDFTGHAPDEWSVTVGAGQIRWKEVLEAAQAAGVKYYFIEDEAKEAAEQIPNSLAYLRGL
ncbi:MAG: sugar phosphate isomerase/epimerase [Bacteroidia bacterium]|nr:sugar phosphate isomerase/epimerase [Bacteroidia bacterium]